MKCNNCGAEVSDANEFCPQCGHALDLHRPSKKKPIDYPSHNKRHHPLHPIPRKDIIPQPIHRPCHK